MGINSKTVNESGYYVKYFSEKFNLAKRVSHAVPVSKGFTAKLPPQASEDCIQIKGSLKKVIPIRNDVAPVDKSQFEAAVDEILEKLKDPSINKEAMKKELMSFNVDYNQLGQIVIDKFSKKFGLVMKPRYFVEPLETGQGYSTGINADIRLNSSPKFLSEKDIADLKMNIEKCQNLDDEAFLETKIVQLGKEVPLPSKCAKNYSNYYIKRSELSPQSQRILITFHELGHTEQNCKIARHMGMEEFKYWADSEKLEFDDFAKEFYEKNIDHLNKITNGKLSQRDRALSDAYKNYPDPRDDFNGYWNDFGEVEARGVEDKVQKNSLFKLLEEVFQKVNQN